jgi:hypothetical protein
MAKADAVTLSKIENSTTFKRFIDISLVTSEIENMLVRRFQRAADYSPSGQGWSTRCDLASRARTLRSLALTVTITMLTRSRGGRMAKLHEGKKDNELSMLRDELQNILKERDLLLRVSGAAAVFLANMDAKALPKHVLEAADVLAQMVNAVPEEVLEEALEAVQAEVALDVPERRRGAREE